LNSPANMAATAIVRKLATSLQHPPPTSIAGLQAAGPRSLRARTRRGGGFAIPASYAAPASSEAVNALTFEVDPSVGARQRRDHGFDAALGKIGVDFVAVITLVAKKRGGTCVAKLHQRVEALRLMNLAPSELEGQRIALGIGAQLDFGREAAARAPECFAILIPPFAPTACWCARTIVESMACSSSAGGPRLARVSNTASHTPSLLQRVKRTNTEFQLPYRLGRSRHGAPVRKTQRMPLTVRRLSATAGPRSPRSGSKGLTMCHSACVKSPRLNAASLKEGSF
jgi:hypothetical protein